MMRFLLHTSSTKNVKYTSNPLRNHERAGQRNTFLAVCCEMVLAPRTRFDFWLFEYAFSMASRSNPLCSKKSWSSAHTTANCNCGEMFCKRCQSLYSRTSRWVSVACCPQRMSIRGVTGTGKKLYKTTNPMLMPKNHIEAFSNNRPNQRPQSKRPCSSCGMVRYRRRRVRAKRLDMANTE